MEIVSVADLKIGMFVAEPDCPWTEFNFALQGFVISTPDQVDIFQKKCRFVAIDRSRSQPPHFAPSVPTRDGALRGSPFSATPGAAERGGETLSISLTERRQSRRQRFLDFLHSQGDDEQARELSAELARIEPRYDELANALHRAFQSFANGTEVEMHSLREGLRDVARSLQRTPDAVMWLLRLKQRDEYSFDHAMDVSVNMLLLGCHIGWREDALHELGMAGLLQDVGKIRLPPGLLQKKTGLTGPEKSVIRSHVASSLKMLRSLAVLPENVIVTVSRHHERWNGSGYPAGLRFEQIGTAGEIAGLADSFCAMLKEKPYRTALGHQEALEELHEQRGKAFNPVLVEQFVQCVGLYPIGTLVELSSGEVGVVIQQNRVHRSRPRVVIMLDADKAPVRTYRIVDLREARHANLRVARALPQTAYGLTAHDFYLR